MLQFVDGWTAFLGRDAVQRLPRQIEVDGMKRIAQVRCEVGSQVKDRHTARFERLWSDEASICVEIEVVTRLELEGDQKRIFLHGLCQTGVRARKVQLK